MWVNFNVKLAEMQLKHESLTIQVHAMDMKMKSVEQGFNDMNLKSSILDERQQAMNVKLEKILQILEKKYESKRTSYHLQIDSTDTMGLVEIERLGFHSFDCIFCPDVLFGGYYGASFPNRTCFEQSVSL
jgi:hypothetical protein